MGWSRLGISKVGGSMCIYIKDFITHIVGEKISIEWHDMLFIFRKIKNIKYKLT